MAAAPDARLDRALSAALDAFAAPSGCSTQRGQALMQALMAAAHAAGPGAALGAASAGRLRQSLAAAASPQQAHWVLCAAMAVCGSAARRTEFAGTPGAAGAVAALLSRWSGGRCAGPAADLAAFLLSSQDGDESKPYAFATALLAAPGDAPGALLSVAAGAGRPSPSEQAGALFALGTLTTLLSDAGAAEAPRLLTRCANDAHALRAAARLLAGGGGGDAAGATAASSAALAYKEAQGPLKFLQALSCDKDGLDAAARTEGVAAAVAARLVRARGPQGDVIKWRSWLAVLSPIMTSALPAAAEAAAVRGALPALVGLLNSDETEVRCDAARAVGVAALASPDAKRALLRLPTLAALVALLRREGAEGTCAGDCSTCWGAFMAAAELTHGEGAEEPRRTLAALLAASPGALAAAARLLEAIPPSDLAFKSAPLLAVIGIPLADDCDADVWRRYSAAAMPALLPAAARALAARLEGGAPPGAADAALGYAASVRNAELLTIVSMTARSWWELEAGELAPAAAPAEAPAAAAAPPAGSGGAAQLRERLGAARAAVLAAAPGLEAALQRRAAELRAAGADAAAGAGSGAAAAASGVAQDDLAQDDLAIAQGTEMSVIRSLRALLSAGRSPSPAADLRLAVGRLTLAAAAEAEAEAEDKAVAASGGLRQEPPSHHGGGSSGTGSGGSQGTSGASGASGSGASGASGGSGGTGSTLRAEQAPAAAAAAPPVPTCQQCGSATAPGGGRPPLCRGCRSVRFCSAECQAAGWRAGHKAECAQLEAARQERLRAERGRQPDGRANGAAAGDRSQ
ncbi:MAG: hypothetical protein J3K34DRAFT_458211 [Monoraphidium minutum]|nr:MAG: hypothetical protein J3K34DRAFT_458211 [Monoraphidium minutum]